jgi:hypothetical protein
MIMGGGNGGRVADFRCIIGGYEVSFIMRVLEGYRRALMEAIKGGYDRRLQGWAMIWRLGWWESSECMGGNGGALIGPINEAVQRCYDEGAKMEVYDG